MLMNKRAGSFTLHLSFVWGWSFTETHYINQTTKLVCSFAAFVSSNTCAEQTLGSSSFAILTTCVI